MNTNISYPTLADLLERHNLSVTRRRAVDLIDASFVITSLKQFNSRFDPDGYSYYAICADSETGEAFSVILGAKAIVDLLDGLLAAGIEPPFEVKLRRVEGGRYGRYYILE